MPSVGFATSTRNSIDMSKIQDMMKQCNVQILVGFPSGRPHIEAKHETINGEIKNSASVSTDESGNAIETAELAEKLHYGAGNIPARPFLDDALNEAQNDLSKAIKQELEKIIQGTSEGNWDKIGTMAVGSVQEFVRGPYYKTNIPNSPVTIELKGSDKPLIDGGDLINSLTYIVEKT